MLISMILYKYYTLNILFMKQDDRHSSNKNTLSQSLNQQAHDRLINVLPRLQDKKRLEIPAGVFASGVQRFNTKLTSETPGPGSYELSQSRTIKQIKREDLLPREHMWILENQRSNSFIKSPTGIIGPGSYQINPSRNKTSVKGDWGMVERFEQKKQPALGPGTYHIEASKQFCPVVAFKSNQARSYLDKLVFKTNQMDKANSLNIRTFKDTSPGPGAYLNEEDELERPKANSFNFNSKVPRFPARRNDLNLAPGMYNQEGSFDKAPSPKRVLKLAKLPEKLVRQRQFPEPGPGEYETPESLQNRLLKKYLNGYKGDFGTHEERFQYTKYNKVIPGPGHYHQPERTIEQEHKLKQLKVSSSFISNSDRDVFISQMKKQVPLVGNYNLKMYDISYNAQKKRDHIDKLKRIEIEIPAFEIGAKR